MNLRKIFTLVIVLSLLTTLAFACNNGGGGGDDNEEDDGNGGDNGNGETNPPDDGTNPGTGDGSGAGPGHVATQIQQSGGGFYGSLTFEVNGVLINSDFERYCYYKELVGNQSLRDWMRLAYPTPFNDSELKKWAYGKWVQAEDRPVEYEKKMSLSYNLTCENIFPTARAVSLAAQPSPTTFINETPETYPTTPKAGFPFGVFAIAGLLAIAFLVLRQRK